MQACSVIFNNSPVHPTTLTTNDRWDNPHDIDVRFCQYSGAYHTLAYLLHDGGVEPVGDDDDRETRFCDVAFKFGDFRREIFFFRIDDHESAVIVGVEAGEGSAENLL